MNPERMGKPKGGKPAENPADPKADDQVVEVKTGELDPVATEIVSEVPDRPKTDPKTDDQPVEVKTGDVQETPKGDDEPAAPAPRVLLIAGGALVAGLGLVLSLRRSAAAPSTPSQSAAAAPAAPAAPASRAGMVIK